MTDYNRFVTLTVVVDIKDQRYHTCHEAHVTQCIGSCGNSVAPQIFTFLLFLLILVDCLSCDVPGTEINHGQVFTLGNEILPFSPAQQACLSVERDGDIFFC